MVHTYPVPDIHRPAVHSAARYVPEVCRVGVHQGGYGYLLRGRGFGLRLAMGWPKSGPKQARLSLAVYPDWPLRLSSHRSRTQTGTRVRTVRVNIHERGGSAKGILVSS